MTKQKMVDMIANKSGLTKKDVDIFVDAFIDTIKSTLATEKKLVIAGFGIFEVRIRAERKGVNPRTKEEIIIPETKYPAFKPAKSLKEAVCKLSI